MADIKPTPYPAKKRPAIKSGCEVAIVCRMTPRLKTKAVDKIKPILRPKKSAVGAAVSAPRKVPNDRMETIRDSWPELMPGSPSASVYPVENVSFQYGISRIPVNREQVWSRSKQHAFLKHSSQQLTRDCACVISEEQASEAGIISIPPNDCTCDTYATKIPMTIATQAAPGSSSGFCNPRPISANFSRKLANGQLLWETGRERERGEGRKRAP